MRNSVAWTYCVTSPWCRSRKRSGRKSPGTAYAALRHRKLKLERGCSPSLEATPELIKLAQTFLLDTGELEALRLMQQSPGAILLTDDAAARLVAERLEYEVHGTIGVVLRALRRRQRTKRQVLNLLRSVPRRSSLFIQRRLLEAVIEQVEHA